MFSEKPQWHTYVTYTIPNSKRNVAFARLKNTEHEHASRFQTAVSMSRLNARQHNHVKGHCTVVDKQLNGLRFDTTTSTRQMRKCQSELQPLRVKIAKYGVHTNRLTLANETYFIADKHYLKILTSNPRKYCDCFG